MGFNTRVPLWRDSLQAALDPQKLVLRAAREDRDKWIRAFNSLEKAVTKVLDEDHPADMAYLQAAHNKVMEEIGPDQKKGGRS